jgi:hypothetical protein
LLIGFNDLASQHPEIGSEADGWDPISVIQRSGAVKPWICKNGHRWKARIIHRVEGIGCPSCATHGYDVNKQGYLYLIMNSKWQMLQIGITNSPVTRLRSHRKTGWTLIEISEPMDGQVARNLESRILGVLEKNGAILGVEGTAGKFDGFTEAWVEASFPVTSLSELMALVERDVEN